MKIVVGCVLIIASCFAEPPVENRYLPPHQGVGPSQTYGPPGAVSGFGQRHTDAFFRGRQSFGSNQRSNIGRPSTQYGGPSFAQQPSTQYGTPSFGQQPSTQYGLPQNSQPSTHYGAPNLNGNRGSRPSVEYGVPSIGGPSQQYGAPGLSSAGVQQYNQGSFGGPSSGSYRVLEQSRQYLPPGRGGYNGDEGNSEPANYSFEYMVKDDLSGNDFGHRESRQGDRAEGLYYVLLPDGRKQTVKYEADQGGYRPTISYEDTGAGQGYDRNSQQHGYQDYQNQGPY